MIQLIYILDPMCSWCWGFRDALAEFRQTIGAHELRHIMGGLAKDSDAPMAPEMREYVQGAWRAVEERTSARFNHAFWERCHPRRSTYPACRGVLAAGLQGAKAPMIEAIQQAYYLEARNPSDYETLTELAREIGLDPGRFAREVCSPEVEDLLHDDFDRRRELGVRTFPTLLRVRAGGHDVLASGFATATEMRARIS